MKRPVTMSQPKEDSLSDLLAELGRLNGSHARERRLPPVENWNPPHCGDIGMEIRADGSWWHQNGRISRPAMVELFATILRKDEDGLTYLVTPGEKVVVHVADAHFLGTRVDRIDTSHGPSVVITTNVGDSVLVGPANPLWVDIDPVTHEPRPYVCVRGRLTARLLRAPFYELVDWAEVQDDRLILQSGSMAFDLGTIEGLTA
jgi:hypothetical protein